jgi:hypothetical protein
LNDVAGIRLATPLDAVVLREGCVSGLKEGAKKNFRDCGGGETR